MRGGWGCPSPEVWRCRPTREQEVSLSTETIRLVSMDEQRSQAPWGFRLPSYQERREKRRGGEGRERERKGSIGGEALYKGCLSVRLPSTALIKEQGEKQQFSSASGSIFPVISLGREMLISPHEGLLVLLFVCLFF